MSTGAITATANIEGIISPAAEAKISVMDRGFLYGDSIYEVFRTYTGVPFLMGEHFDRLENSAALISMTISQSRNQLVEEIRRTVHASGACNDHDVYVRYQITRGEGPIDLYPSPDLKTRYVIIVKALPPWDPKLYGVGMTVAVPSVRRNPIDALDPNIKGGNYLNNILAITEARKLGADDCVILNHQGFVTEAANSNVWFVLDGKVVTPGSGNLRGLTKNALHKACAAAGMLTEETAIHIDQLADVTECFVSSATREVMPVKSIRLEDGTMVHFPSGGGAMTRRIRSIFTEFIAAYVREHSADRLFAD